MNPRLLPALLLSFAWPLAASAASGPFNVLDFGAVPDGKTLNTAAFAKAVAAAHAVGGGTIVVPAGKYLTGSIELESNLTLDVEAGAELLYSSNPADSPIVAGRFEGTSAYLHASLIHAEGKRNIAVVGRGTLNGQGKLWWWRMGWGLRRQGADQKGADPKKLATVMANRQAWAKLDEQIQGGMKATAADFVQVADYLRPALVETNNCQNFTLEGVTLLESPMWMFHPLYTDNIDVRNVTLESDGPNTDGMDIDSCRDVRISDCFFDTGDDCIVLKSGRAAEGRRIHRPTEHVAITNCVMHNGHGAVVIGSETSGDVRDIVADNIVARNTDRAVRIKSQRGYGAVVENVRCSNFVVEDATSYGIEITSFYRNVPPEPFSERTPVFRNFAFSNFTIVNAAKDAVSVEGLPEKPIQGLRFTDINGTARAGFVCHNVEDVELHDVRIDIVDIPAPSVKAAGVPIPPWHPPAANSPFMFGHAHNLLLANVTSAAPRAAQPVIRLSDSNEVWLRDSRAWPGTGTFLKIDGPTQPFLRLTDNDLSAAAVPTSP